MKTEIKVWYFFAGWITHTIIGYSKFWVMLLVYLGVLLLMLFLEPKLIRLWNWKPKQRNLKDYT